MTLVGPTGGGKTTLGIALLPARQYVTVLGTKPKDATLDKLKRQGYRRIGEWPPGPTVNRVLLWPELRRMDQAKQQRDVFAHALDEMFAEGGWCIFADELFYLAAKTGRWMQVAASVRMDEPTPWPAPQHREKGHQAR